MNELGEIETPILLTSTLSVPRVAEAGFEAVPVTDTKAVKSVVEKFREKYGAQDVKKCYSKFDVAVSVELS